MVSLLYKEINSVYQFAASRGRPLIYVGQGYKSEVFNSKTGGSKSGYREISPGVWRGYDRYMPKNGMSLQFYLSVAAGARGFLLYFYQSFIPGTEKDARSDALVTPEGKETWFWRETGECLKEAKVFFPLFSSWFREVESHAAADDSQVLTPSFIRPDIKGRFFLPVNTHIANWDKTNPNRPNDDTNLKSDGENIQGFEWVGAKTFKLNLKNLGKLWNVQTGVEVDPAKITLAPGKGAVLFQGDAEELGRIRKELKIGGEK
jgi:hypothetical protein